MRDRFKINLTSLYGSELFCDPACFLRKGGGFLRKGGGFLRKGQFWFVSVDSGNDLTKCIAS
ncbi:hypothetical protein CJF27_18060 [Photobacterium iliopiscarium]|nr:hypothetical protein [Photobacterium iliopiscarium]